MNNSLKIKIKKTSQPAFLCWCIILIPFMFGTLISLLNMPNAIKYVLDATWVSLLAFIFLNIMRKKATIIKESKVFYIWVIAFLLFTVIAYVLNYQSFLYYLWGFRNNFRFYIAFFAFAIFLKEEDILNFWKIVDFLFWINVLVCLIQYFVFGFHQDYLGGIFGTTVGCNGYLNIFFVITITKSILFYLNKKENVWVCMLKCGAALLICAFAELKFFYVEFIVILVLAIILTEFSWRKFLLVIGGIIGVMFATQLLGKLFPVFNDIFTIKALFESAYEGGYSSAVSLNRLNTIPIISERFLTTLPDKLFGFGLGNCDTAAYSIVNTPFYIKYSYLRYNWFSTAFIFLETGFIGLIFFFTFFIMIYVLTVKMMKRNSNSNDKIYYQITAVVSICCILIGIYNATLRVECGYMIYFVLAFPFILQKSKTLNAANL